MADKNDRRKHRITGKIIIRAILKNASPLLIGTGEGDASDLEVIRWVDDKPYLPGSSLAGCLKAKAKATNGGILDEGGILERFWGSEKMTEASGDERKTHQSHLILEDARCLGNHPITIRDGVRIEHETGIALGGGKYDYELVERGAEFIFKAEVTIRNGMDADKVKDQVEFIGKTLKNDFRAGAMTTTCFGRLELGKFTAWHFDFPKNAEDWFDFLDCEQNGTKYRNDTLLLKDIDLNRVSVSQDFTITAQFRLKSALITGSYGVKSADPDKSHLTSNGKPVLSGKAIKGAIRHRALKILKTIGDDKAEEHIDHLMGWVKSKMKKEDDIQKENKKEAAYDTKAIKSRLTVEESNINKAVKAMTQDRIKIDRFTGGVLGGAKFDSQPVWDSGNGIFEITFNLDEKAAAWEKALLLHLLKDLWTEDLAIGGEKNVGRGILVGQSATIRDRDKSATIDRIDQEKLEIRDEGSLLEELNEALNLELTKA